MASPAYILQHEPGIKAFVCVFPAGFSLVMVFVAAEGRTSPGRKRRMLKTLLFATILLAAVTTAVAAAPAEKAALVPAGSIHTYLMPDLSLKSATDADCGGGIGSCSHFIGCCAKGTGRNCSRARSSLPARPSYLHSSPNVSRKNRAGTSAPAAPTSAGAFPLRVAICSRNIWSRWR